MKYATHALGALGVLLLLAGTGDGLILAPPDRYMGELARIMYVHVPTAWATLLCLTFAFGFAVASLGVHVLRPASTWTRRWDGLVESAVEVGVVLGVLLSIQGSIWARPTWGVWWSWDPRLTTVAVTVLAFGGILALRSSLEDPRQRAILSSVASILSFAGVPLIYLSVRLWASLHQTQSSTETVDTGMARPLAINAVAMMLVTAWLVAQRYGVARRRLDAEVAEAA